MKKVFAILTCCMIVLLTACQPATPKYDPPPSTTEIDALIFNKNDVTSSNGMINAYFYCTVTAEEKASGVTTIWSADYVPDSSQNISMTIVLKKVNGKWELADKARLQSCFDEKNTQSMEKLTEEASTPSK